MTVYVGCSIWCLASEKKKPPCSLDFGNFPMLFMIMDKLGLYKSGCFLLIGQYEVTNNKTLIQLCAISWHF